MTTTPLYLEEMTWPELNAKLDDIDIVLIPVGATEQHGPNLSLKSSEIAALEGMRVEWRSASLFLREKMSLPQLVGRNVNR